MPPDRDDILRFMTTIYIARHGQNEDNARGILNGHRDLPLTDLGRQQARQLARHIKDRELVFDAVYASPLDRAFETAAIVATALGLAEPIVHDDLIERDFGIMTGKLAADIEEICAPDIIKAENVTYFLHPDGAETFPELLARRYWQNDICCGNQHAMAAGLNRFLLWQYGYYRSSGRTLNVI